MSLLKSFLTASLVALLPAVSRATLFTDVVDTTTVISAGTYAGKTFGQFTASGVVTPPVLNQGHVLFLGAPAGQSNNAAFDWSGGSVNLLADSSVSIPGRPGSNFSEIRYPSTFGGQYSFSSYDGIYTTVSGVLTKVIDPSDGYSGSSAPSNDGTNVWFYGETPDSINRWTNGSLTKVVSAGTATGLPNGYTFQSLNTNVSAGGNAVAFYGSGFNITGIYTTSGGTVQRIADTTMTAPGETGRFSSFYNFPIAFDGSDAAFLGSDDVSNTEFLFYTKGVIQTLIANGAAAPGGGKFSVSQGSGAASVDNGAVAVSSKITGGSAVFLESPTEALTRVVGTGDTILGKTVSNVQISNEALSGNQLAFYATFTDRSSGIFIATVPEPTILPSITVAGVLMFRRLRRCRPAI